MRCVLMLGFGYDSSNRENNCLKIDVFNVIHTLVSSFAIQTISFLHAFFSCCRSLFQITWFLLLFYLSFLSAYPGHLFCSLSLFLCFLTCIAVSYAHQYHCLFDGFFPHLFHFMKIPRKTSNSK